MHACRYIDTDRLSKPGWYFTAPTAHISMNWRGKPLVDHETIVSLIGATTTKTGLRIQAGVDRGTYPKGVKVPDDVMDGLSLHRDRFHGEWNYTLRPES